MKGPARTRDAAQLSASLTRQLSQYALAASAAGVGMLVLAQPTEAKIVYTKTNESVHKHGSFVNIDLNHDGKVDFKVAMEFNYATTWLSAVPVPGDRVAGYETGGWGHSYVLAYALLRGVDVGSGVAFVSGGGIMAGRTLKGQSSGVCWGKWNDVKRRYLGLEFLIKGQVHYGWARLNESCMKTGMNGVKALLTGYAYETIPNKPIITGKTKGPDVITLEPGSLGALAAAASQQRR